MSDTVQKIPHNDPSTRYRCFNLAKELSLLGVRAHAVPQETFELRLAELRGFDHYVFHRPRLSPQLARFLVERDGKGVSADFDDLIFDVRYAELTPAVRIVGQSAERVRQYVASLAEALPLMRSATASTAPLAEHLQRHKHLQVSVLHNHLDRGFIGLTRVLRTRPARERPFTFGYFPGTATHRLDFAMVAPALADTLRADPGARLLIVGPLELPEPLAALGPRISRAPIVPFHSLPALMALCRTVLAPLEETPFALCKSGLKFFEAALCGCRVIATPIPDIERFDSELLVKCSTPEQWRAALAEAETPKEAVVEQAAARLEEQVSSSRVVPKWLREVGWQA